jgi:uncharacterized protein (DUF305 family)
MTFLGRPSPGARGRAIALAVALSLGSAALAGCGSANGADPQTSNPRPTTYTAAEQAGHNDIDVDFAQMMLVHTRQSVDLVALASERSDQPEILQLTGQLAVTDAETIEEMTGLLESWGEDVPDEIALTDMDHSQMDHAGIGMGFMAGISDDQVTLLSSLDGEPFDKKFLRFILTHRGAGVAMAQSERIYGQSGELTKMAKSIESEQADEMQTIQDLMKTI